MIEINDLSFSYSGKVVFDHFNLTITKGSYTTIAGANGSGKSTLLRLLVGLYPYQGTIQIAGTRLSETNKQELRSKIGMVFENPDMNFVTETVEDELVFAMENKNYSESVMKARLEELISLFGLEAIKDASIHQLSGGEKQLVALSSAMALKPSLLLLDEAFTMIDGIQKEKILRILKKLNQETGITIVQVTHDLADSLYGTDLILMKSGKVLEQGPKKQLLINEKLIKKASLEPPFMVLLSQKLAYYDLIKEPIFDMNRMVNELWK